MCPRWGLMTLTKKEVFPSSLVGPSTRLPLSARPLGDTRQEALREYRASDLFALDTDGRLVHHVWGRECRRRSNPGNQDQLVFRRQGDAGYSP